MDLADELQPAWTKPRPGPGAALELAALDASDHCKPGPVWQEGTTDLLDSMVPDRAQHAQAAQRLLHTCEEEGPEELARDVGDGCRPFVGLHCDVEGGLFVLNSLRRQVCCRSSLEWLMMAA